MTLLAENFPAIITIVIAIVLVFAIRLATKRSRGAVGAGPVLRPEALVPGLNETAWDLTSIDKTLSDAPHDSLHALRQLAQTNRIELPPPSGDLATDINAALNTLEKELGMV